MILRHLIACLLAVEAVLAAPLESRSMAFRWGNQVLRGVNIGGWLVLEPWITPSIFQSIDQSLGVVDEFTLGQKLPQTAPGILRNHWDSWVNWNDFKKISDAGFNLVRIPVGFWAYDNTGTPYVQGAAPYIDAAIDWARSLGLKILIDLHGAPGSQNGFDNSGQRKDPNTIGFGQGSTVQQTLGVIQTIAQKYAQTQYQDVVVGIELLNEPLGWKLDSGMLRQFVRDGYGNVRAVSDTTVIFSDAFNPPNTWNGFLTPQDANAQHVAIDHHEYQIFSNDDIAMVPWQHRQAVCNRANEYTGADKWTFVGEWTGAMTDCAFALNGYGFGARYDGTYPGSKAVGSCANFNDISRWDQTMKDDYRGYIEAQIETYEAKTQGWIFWNFKTEGAAEWDLFRLLDAGVFPNPVTSRKFGAICS